MFLKKLKIGEKMFLGFGMITILMLTILGYSYINFSKQSKDVNLNLQTYNVIRETDTMIISLINMETGARGFALTGDEKFLEPFNQGKASYEMHYNKIKQLTTDNYHQQDRLENLNNSYQTWLQWENTKILDVRRKITVGLAKMEDLIAIIASGEGKDQMDTSRIILDDIVKEEEQILVERQNKLAKMESQTAIVLSLGGLLATLLSIVISILVIRMVVEPIVTVTNTFKEISDGDVDLDVRLKTSSDDELGEMARYFNTFMTKLKELIIENQNYSWIKTGQAELNEKTRGEQDIVALSSNIITYISKYLNAQVGAVYIKAADNTFNLFGSYAYSQPENLSKKIIAGRGIIGQAILEKNTIVVENVPEDYIKIESGMGMATPRNILVTPFVYDNEVIGVIELGSFNKFTAVQLNFLEVVSSGIASTVNSQEVRVKVAKLLYKTMEQSEELQSQQEELRQNNEELEEQTRALKESEAYLQKQQEQLRVANEELEEHTKVLVKQKNDIYNKNENLKKAQIQIQEKAKALEIASNYKSEFLANMSHELRTPLNSILVLSQMLAGKNDTTPLTIKQLEFAKTIHSSGKDLLTIINDILDLSKVQAGKMDINFEKLNLSELAKYVDRTFRAVATQKGLSFKFQIEDGLPEDIVSDSQRVQQIVNNLISNAIKFTSNGDVTMTIHAAENLGVLNSYNDIQDFIGISITDTGIGIPIDKQSVIFDAFKQSDGTTSRKYGGTGLGLSISTELAQLLGGWIYLVSNEGLGSTFTLILPLIGNGQKQSAEDFIIENIRVKNEISEYDTTIKNDSINDIKIINSNERFLLIIEDDEDFAKVLLELAHEKGYKCLIAKDGLTGIDFAVKYEPDAILLDIGLPDISGWKVVENLKKNKKTMNISVHVISGGNYCNSSEKINNVLSYLKKPVSLEGLEDVFIKIQHNILKPVKKILILDVNIDEFGTVEDVLGKKGYQITLSDSGLEAYNLLKTELFDCLILNLKTKDISGFDLLAKLNRDNVFGLQIIIHTEDELSQDDELELQKYTQSIIIKGARSTERLVSEVSLFLHDLDSKIEGKKINIIKCEHEMENSLKNKKVLVVDDDMRNIFALTSLLEEKGIEVVVGRTGLEGIKRLNENPDIDLILMDIMMPDMDGYEAMCNIRRGEKFKRKPIIAITAKAMKDEKQKCIDAGADDYLTKPIDMDKLISLLRVWLYK
ncbi:response regulator [Clostridium lacusfryxellense]|uniref:response regulator n=1 Tax=Clostridium lacusfryxellense TaxID=205328 RepID=UPI001C0E2D92|nr:response regulator [Clostridium lacusfryxellense]MBU3112902.1 response regulator [Clostridium lacusfryxellense]